MPHVSTDHWSASLYIFFSQQTQLPSDFVDSVSKHVNNTNSVLMVSSGLVDKPGLVTADWIMFSMVKHMKVYPRRWNIHHLANYLRIIETGDFHLQLWLPKGIYFPELLFKSCWNYLLYWLNLTKFPALHLAVHFHFLQYGHVCTAWIPTSTTDLPIKNADCTPQVLVKTC